MHYLSICRNSRYASQLLYQCWENDYNLHSLLVNKIVCRLDINIRNINKCQTINELFNYSLVKHPKHRSLWSVISSLSSLPWNVTCNIRKRISRAIFIAIGSAVNFKILDSFALKTILAINQPKTAVQIIVNLERICLSQNFRKPIPFQIWTCHQINAT